MIRTLVPVLAILVVLATAACAGERSAAPPDAGSTTAAAQASTSPTAGAGAPTTPRADASVSTPAGAVSCRPQAPLTLAQTEGPFYKAGPPQRASLVETGGAGTRLALTGVVRGPDCEPLPGARVDFWQTDATGAYDNAGYRFRGYQLTDATGAYRLESVVPAEYPGRTAHIHVKVTPAGGPTLTSQLYFPDAARNASDGIFRPELVVRDLVRGPEGVSARFDFVVATR